MQTQSHFKLTQPSWHFHLFRLLEKYRTHYRNTEAFGHSEWIETALLKHFWNLRKCAAEIRCSLQKNYIHKFNLSIHSDTTKHTHKKPKPPSLTVASQGHFQSQFQSLVGFLGWWSASTRHVDNVRAPFLIALSEMIFHQQEQQTVFYGISDTLLIGSFIEPFYTYL